MITSVENAIDHIKSHQNIFIHSAAAIPQHLVNELARRNKSLKGIQIYQLHTEKDAPYAQPEMKDSFTVNAFFVGKNTRNAIQEGRGSYIPIFLSEITHLFKRGIIKLDVALITVSPPDKHGFCSLGVSVDISKAAVEAAKVVIAQVNVNMPRSHGDGLIHVSEIDCMVEFNEPIGEHISKPTTDVEKAIGQNIANQIEDGSTLQMGIGAIPDAVLECLVNHKNLGIHTEMFSNGILPLVKSGVINGHNKIKHPRTIVSSFAVGSRELYDFIDDNPQVKMLNSVYVNNTDVIRKNPKVVAINSALEIDLTGQVCADSIGHHIYSGVGGQMDFIRGASISEDGKPFIALASTTKNGSTKIVPTLKQGAGVVTTRAHIHYVATEYGCVNLFGKTLKERANLLISISHPDHREELERQAHVLNFE